MNIYDKITNCEKIACFIEGSNINSITFLYKKEMLKTQFYDIVLSLIDNTAKVFLIDDITVCGYETESSKVVKTIFSGSYTKMQKLVRGVI